MENSVEVEHKLVERVKDDNGDVTNMEENSDDEDEDLTEVLNTLRGFLDEDLDKRLRDWDERMKSLGSEIADVDDLVNVYDETIARDDAESDVKNSLLFISS